MKKILAVALCLVLLFVAVPVLTTTDVNACDGPPPLYGYSVCMEDGAVGVFNGDNILDFGARTLGTDTINIDVPLIWENFLVWDTATNQYVHAKDLPGMDRTILTSRIMDNITLEFEYKDTADIFKRIEKESANSGRDAKFILTAEAIGVARGGVRLVYRHMDPSEITYSEWLPINGRVIDPTINKDIVGIVDKKLVALPTKLNGYTGDSDDKNLLDEASLASLGVIAPDSYIAFYLNTDSFEWNPLINAMATSMRKSTLENNKISIVSKKVKGANLIESVEFENLNGSAYVVVRFVEKMAATEEKDFQLEIKLAQRGVSNNETMVTIAGTLANEEINVDNMDYAYLGDGVVAVVDEYTRNIQLDLGAGVSIYRNLETSKKYFGIATDERTNADLDIMDAYPSIRRVVNLTTKNIKASGNIVQMNLTGVELPDGTYLADDGKYFIYDADGRFLGMSNERLPYRDKYYFSESRISLDTAMIGVLEDDMEVAVEVGNSTDNPSTGAANNKLMAAGVVFLLAGGILSTWSRGYRKVLSMLLAITIVSTLALPVQAKTNSQIPSLDHIVESPFHAAYEGNAAIAPETTFAGDEIIVPIMAKGWKDKDGIDIIWDEEDQRLGPTVAQLSGNQVRPKLMVTAGRELIRDYEFVKYTPTPSVRAQSALRIRFVEDLVSTSEITYQFTIRLTYNGKSFDAQEKYGGMISNPIIEVFEKDYINLEHGDICHAFFSDDEVQVHVGNGVDFYTDMVRDEKYYGVARVEGNEGQTQILRDYPVIDETYEIKTVNLKTHGNVVEFTRFENDPHYVYNIKGEYLGTTKERLPYSTRYYLSPTEIEIDVDPDLLEKDIQSEFPASFPSAAVDRFAAGIEEEEKNTPEDVTLD